MSTLTKVFVVLLAIFSIAFTTMTVATVARTTDWRQLAEKYDERARIADTSLRNLIAATAAQEAAARDAIQNHLERIGELEKKLDEATAQSAALRTELAKIEASKSSTEAMNRALLNQIELARTAEAQVREQRDNVDRENIDVQQRNIDLNARVNELTSQVAVLAEQKRQYEQQLNLLKGDVQRLSQSTQRPSSVGGLESPTGSAMRNVRPLEAAPAVATGIRGKILAVDRNLVTLSVGRSDGVRENMKFVVHRGGDYVADLRIDAVDPNQAVGRVLGNPSNRPQRGDAVTDAISLGSNR